MDDSYQPIYQAVRSRIGNFDGQALIDQISRQFDFSQYAAILHQEQMIVTYEQQRPSILLKPKISIDGNQWCALYGENLQDGVAGFGDSPDKAMVDFDKNWRTDLPERKTK